MKSKYWIKLWHETLDDPKMGRLSDRLYRRSIELFLVAGDLDNKGFLPPIDDIAWRLHQDPEQLETEMIALQEIGILSTHDGHWYVTNFEKRQAAAQSTERWRQYQSRQRKASDPAPPGQPAKPQTHNKRYTNESFAYIEEESESEEIEAEAKAEADPNIAAAAPVLNLLHEAGIYDPTARQLTEKPWMNEAYLKAHILQAQADGIKAGLLITRLLNADPAPLTQDQLKELENTGESVNDFIERQRYTTGEFADYIEH